MDAAYAALLAEDRVTPFARTKRHVLSAALMTRLVNENRALLDVRPSMAENTAVRYSDKGLARLENLVNRYSAPLQNFTDGTWPTLMELHNAFELSRLYVPFETLLADLRGLVARAVDRIRELRKGGQALICLALPDSRVDKSSIWFNAYLWANTDLSQHIDFVVPSTIGVGRLLNLLGPEWTAHVFYVDDMAYSGSQMAEFCLGEAGEGRDPDSRVTIHPLLAYTAQQVPRRFWGYTNGMIQFHPSLTIPVPEMGYWLQRATRSLPSSDNWQETLRDFIRNISGEEKYMIQVYAQFVGAIGFPIVLFEHKLADFASIPVELFMQVLQDPNDPDALPVDNQLVQIGDDNLPMDHYGTSAFYKSLQWTYQGLALPSTDTLESMLHVHLGLPIPPSSLPLQVNETLPDEVVKRIVSVTDEDAQRTVAQANQRLRDLTTQTRRGVRLVITSDMVEGLGPAPREWYNHTYEYPQLKARLQALVASSAQVPLTHLTIELDQSPLTRMPALPPALTSQIRSLTLVWGAVEHPGFVPRAIPKVIFTYPNLNYLSARAFSSTSSGGPCPSLQVLECIIITEFMGSSWTSRFPNLSWARLELAGDVVTHFPPQVKTLWLEHHRPMALNLQLNDQTVEPYALEHLIITHATFSTAMRCRADLFINVLRVTLRHCVFMSNAHLTEFKDLFSVDTHFILDDVTFPENPYQ
jgi:hypothetical protein